MFWRVSEGIAYEMRGAASKKGLFHGQAPKSWMGSSTKGLEKTVSQGGYDDPDMWPPLSHPFIMPSLLL